MSSLCTCKYRPPHTGGERQDATGPDISMVCRGVLQFLLRLCVSVLPCLALWPSSLNAQGITFRSAEFQFRFVYPAGWTKKIPRGPNVKALVDAPDGMSNCNIVVRRNSAFAGKSQREIDAAFFASPVSEADWKELYADKFTDLKVLDSRLTKVDNQFAQFAVTEMSYTSIITVYAVQMQFFTVTPGLFWHFTCSAAGPSRRIANINFQKMRPTFTAILSSFVFER